MKCRNGCGKENKGRSAYCSDKCKVGYNRNKKRNNKSVTGLTVTPAILDEFDNIKVGTISLTANQLYAAIRSYPQDTWRDSPEFKELMRRLHSMSIDQLESGGYRVPAWKYEQKKIAC